MSNLKYLVENNPYVAKDIFDDQGRLLCFAMIDLVPSAPWSGLWIRQDWLDELGMEIPSTIDEWEKVLYAMKDLKGVAPLGINFNSFYGVQTNYPSLSSVSLSPFAHGQECVRILIGLIRGENVTRKPTSLFICG